MTSYKATTTLRHKNNEAGVHFIRSDMCFEYLLVDGVIRYVLVVDGRYNLSMCVPLAAVILPRKSTRNHHDTLKSVL